MFKIESYVTPILLSYVDKYVRDFKPADAQVSLWGGGVALHNLVLKADVLQQEVSLPFTLVSGRIHELLIQVPWTKIMSEPIVVTIDTIECVLSLTQPPGASEENVAEAASSPQKSQVMEAPPGYMQALVRRIVSNIALRVHHLIVKYVQDDIVMSLNVKHLAVDSAGPNWEPAFADIDQAQPVIRRLMRLDDLTLCLDQSDSDGKIRFYQEPLLYRCQLDFRVLTTLVSANSRRASGLSIQVRSSKLAWGLTGDQLAMLIRLVRERTFVTEAPPTAPAKSTDTPTQPSNNQSKLGEPARSESWSEWAWSWMPTLVDREYTAGVQSTPAVPTPVPVHVAAYIDDVSLVFKVMEHDHGNRRRSRGVLELIAKQTAFKSYVCKPTTIRMRLGTRSFALMSRGKCTCSHLGYHALLDEPTYYIQKKDSGEADKEWTWPEDDLSQVVETAQVADEQLTSSTDAVQQDPPLIVVAELTEAIHPEQSTSDEPTDDEPKDDGSEFWKQMAPQFYVEYVHDRSPPEISVNPYENPPLDFEYSDWVEECNIKILLQPMDVRVSMGLIHRLNALGTVFRELPAMPLPDLPMRVLTVEECEALSENLPQRRINIEVLGLRFRVRPYDHATFERPTVAPLVLDIELPKTNLIVTGPLYPHRVCVAACQMPEDSGPLWQGARLHMTLTISSVQAKICSNEDTKARPCARADVTAVVHVLMNQEYFMKRESIEIAYSVKISEANICGSAARLQAACQVPSSLCSKQISAPLRYTTLASDALNDDESVAIDLTFEDLICRGFFTRNTTTHIITLQSTKATALHESKGSELKQAWLFSGPDAPTNTPYFRLAVQYCKKILTEQSIEYAGIWTEPTAVAVDPLFIAWLAYRPTLRHLESLPSMGSLKSLSSLYFMRRRTTPSSSSGRGGSKPGSGAEVHMRGRSLGSSDRALSIGRSHPQAKSPLENYWGSDKLLQVHEWLQRMLVNVEIGLTLVYVNNTTASALDCETLRDAMERHAATSQHVTALSLGRLTMFSNTLTRSIWNEIRHDGPTFEIKSTKPQVQDSFPWKLLLADVSIYTLEVTSTLDKSGKDSYGLRSQLRNTCAAKPRTILELVTSSVTVSVVTKQKQIKKITKKESVKKEKEPTPEETRVKYFTLGMDFKPSTLKEFVRGPARRKKEKSPEPEKKVIADPESDEVVELMRGPMVSLGIHVHADTPPLVFRMEHDQVQVFSAAIHCLTHIQSLLRRPRLYIPRESRTTSTGLASKTYIRSGSAAEELQSPSTTTSEEKSELIPIFEAQSIKALEPVEVKTFFWFQWVVSRITVVATTNKTKLALVVDDIISSVDLQPYYNQYKVKVASASIKHYARTGADEWAAGVLGGRVLEAREPTNAKDDNHFLAVTITQAQVANLPASWKEELHPKLLERKRSTDSMWEVYATLAPLEAVIQPKILNQIISLVYDLAPRSHCPLAQEKDILSKQIHWPFCYISAGGLRLLLTVQDEKSNLQKEDTFMFVIGKITVNPHPENPICRRPVNPTSDNSGWVNNASALDGQQYELMIKNIGVRCAQFYQLVNLENSEQEMVKGTASENPALKWTQQVVLPKITPLLHSLDVGCILAPALYVNGSLSYGRALEVNLMSDCSLEVSIEQLNLAQKVVSIMVKAFKERKYERMMQLEGQDICPYATILLSPVDSQDSYAVDNRTAYDCDDARTSEQGTYTTKTSADIFGSAHGADSGVDVGTASKSGIEANITKKSVSVAFVEPWSDSSEFYEIFVTMGTIELCLYTLDDGSPEIKALLPPENWKKPVAVEKNVEVPVQSATKVDKQSEEQIEPRSIHEADSTVSPSLASHSGKSVTETTRDVDIGKMKLEMAYSYPPARKGEGSVALLSVTLNQPNLYYWRRLAQKSIQVSLFDLWIGLGAGVTQDLWYATLLSTEKGAADPMTDIPPALATMKLVVPAAVSSVNSSVRGSLRLDIERPVMLEVSSDRLRRLNGIYKLTKDRMFALRSDIEEESTTESRDFTSEGPLLHRIRRTLVNESIESVTLQTTQIGVTGSQGSVGWDALSVQVGAGGRPERLVGRLLVTAAVVAAGPPGDSRHIVMQPVMMGAELEANWEAWRRVEGGLSGREPTVRVCVDIDWLLLDLRPTDLSALIRIRSALEQFIRKHPERESCSSSSESRSEAAPSTVAFPRRASGSSTAETPSEEHFYKDDLRSGAFKIVSGGQLPMAYQVTLHNNAVSWRYPHPRAITRLVIFPLPGEDEETPCVLELFAPLVCQWEAHTYFSVPVSEPREIQLYVPTPDAVSAQMWRFRVLEAEEKPKPFEFDINKFTVRDDPLSYEVCAEVPLPAPSCGVTAEQLSGVVRVDSCFSPRLSPRLRLAARVANLVLYLHNSLPNLTGISTVLEGYYVSKPLFRSHRSLSVRANSASIRAQLASPAGALFLLNAHVSSDILESSTGTMESLVDQFSIRSGLSLPVGLLSRARVALSHVNVLLNVQRLRTLHSLHADWRESVDTYVHQKPEAPSETSSTSIMTYDQNQMTSEALEGRVSLWVHNSCAVALRIGQEGTEEVVPMGPGARLAYRWRSPTAPKKLRFALVGPSDWSWSTSIPFTVDHFRVRLEVPEADGQPAPAGGAYLYTSVEEKGARLCMRLAGRLCLANMLRFHLLYKVRARCNESHQWRTVCSSELQSETVGRTVVCGADCEMSFKIKFTTNDTGWSGDIPLKECPKENVPWLVKVPCEGDLPYMSVWTRVVRSRTDGRIMATVWPLYVLYSHLSLDTDVLVVSESSPDTEDLPPLIQPAPGRGASTHLLTPGTTSARHTLSFQYRNIECPVTKDAVPLHYGMTPTSVFDKRAPTTTLEDVFKETMRWLERSRRFAVSEWPYSIVAKHWPGKWKPALSQPRSDVTVQYCAIRAGGGCSLEVQLRPVVILCNAAPIPLTLRAHDAAPLCRLEPGTAISPPSAVLTKPFFISVEIGRETFVSGELSVTSDELGVYGTPAPGRIALDMPTEMAIHCNHKVALLTMSYEIKKEINILGMTSTYMLINRLNSDILITAMAVSNDDDEQATLRPSTYKVIEPTEPDSVYGTSICKFWVSGRMWRGSDPAELRLFLCISLPNAPKYARSVPVRLGQPPLRRPIALTDEDDLSVAAVVTQVKHEGRWIVTVAPDPCPQILVCNGTRKSITIAQPLRSSEEISTSKTKARAECIGTAWYCTVRPGAATYYSTPSYCSRYPPPAVPPLPAVPFLTFARAQEIGEPDWCAPVALTDGEQLIQMSDDDTVKMRLRTHPHSTLLELRDVDHHDISASDIRRRLMGAFASEDFLRPRNKGSEPQVLERTDAEEQLLAPSVEDSPTQSNVSQRIAASARATALHEERVAFAVTQHGPMITTDDKTADPSTVLLFSTGTDNIDFEQLSKANTMRTDSVDSAEASNIMPGVSDNEWEETAGWRTCDRLRLFASTVTVQLSGVTHVRPLVAVHLDRPAVVMKSDSRRTKTSVSIANLQIDNLQYETGQYDFAVVASTCNETLPEVAWPTMWTLFGETLAFATRHKDARVLLRLTHDTWAAQRTTYRELSEVEVRIGPLGLYVEDAYVTALVSLARSAVRTQNTDALLVEERVLRAPLRLRTLHLHPLDLTLTLHTAVRMYIALDHSPLRLSAFKLTDVMTSSERLTHALTVHYLSAAILGAGWVVGGLELLGAPGALAARVGGATGGVRGVASAAAAALLRSLSAWAGSLARNLDLLAGDEEHAKRAAMARRRPPQSLLAGLTTGITNFAINILGAVGGLAHHPVVGVAVGESESGATALRRGLIGALTKPLSATADLVAYAGQGLLTQTGWDPIPQPRTSWISTACQEAGWRRDCVRWTFRLADVPALAGFHVLLDGAPLHLLTTHKFLVLADPDSERITEMIDFRFCNVGPYQGQIIELVVTQRRSARNLETRSNTEEDNVQISAAAMARVARYTGVEGAGTSSASGSGVPGTVPGETRILAFLTAPGRALSLYAALVSAAHHNNDVYFPLL